MIGDFVGFPVNIISTINRHYQESSLDFISRLMALEALLCRYPSGAQASKSGIRKFTPPRRQWLRQSTLSKILSSEKDIFKLDHE